MAFNKNEYWQKKRERQSISEAMAKNSLIKSMRALMAIFSPPSREHKVDHHKRSIQERMMRRQKHSTRMRSLSV